MTYLSADALIRECGGLATLIRCAGIKRGMSRYHAILAIEALTESIGVQVSRAGNPARWTTSLDLEDVTDAALASLRPPRCCAVLSGLATPGAIGTLELLTRGAA